MSWKRLQVRCETTRQELVAAVQEVEEERVAGERQRQRHREALAELTEKDDRLLHLQASTLSPNALVA